MRAFQKYAFLSLKFILIVFIVSLFFLLPRLVKIKNIACQSQYGPCNQEVSEKIQKSTGRSLESSKAYIRRELKNETLVKDFSFQYKFPSTLQVYISERKPKFSLKSSRGGQISMVDKDGLVLYNKDSTNLPTVVIDDPLPKPSEEVDKKYFFALEIVSALSPYPKSFAKVSGNTLTIELIDQLGVIFPLEGDRDLLLGSFILVYNELIKQTKDSRIKGTLGVIDLRFKNPILRPRADPASEK